MPEIVSREDYLKLADRLFSSNTIDVVRLANKLGIPVFKGKLAGAQKSAEIRRNEDGSYFIVVDENEPYTRQRFSIAHELAHYILHQEKLKESGTLNRDSANSEIEQQADQLAIETLMPKDKVESYIRKKGWHRLNQSILNKIARQFEVSPAAAAIRLRELGYYVGYGSV
jgi:Zn-dependent peptidase ImmA (M78 family)